jgi:anaerobic ribonucleoside-triphosphate reductase
MSDEMFWEWTYCESCKIAYDFEWCYEMKHNWVCPKCGWSRDTMAAWEEGYNIPSVEEENVT